MPLLAVLVLIGIIGGGARLGLPPFPWVLQLWRRSRPRLVEYVVAAPATFLYLLVLTTTSWVLASSGASVDAALLRGHSSNLSALAQDPLHGLVQSAFWVEGWPMFLGALALGVALAPVERWLGTARWLTVFALGHVAGTLLVAAAIWMAIKSGQASPGLRNVVDVGASYGFGAVAGVAAYRLPRRLALAYALGILLVLLGILVLDATFTDLGHLLAFAVGLGCEPLTRSAAARAHGDGRVAPQPTSAAALPDRSS